MCIRYVLQKSQRLASAPTRHQLLKVGPQVHSQLFLRLRHAKGGFGRHETECFFQIPVELLVDISNDNKTNFGEYQ